MEKHSYDGQFRGNILIVGRIGCGKTTFMQKLALNNFFGVLKKAEWVSYIPLTSKREAEIASDFSCPIDFWYPCTPDELIDLLEEFKQKSRSEDEEVSESRSAVKIVFGEKSNRDRLIVLDDVSGLAVESKKFASFLTVAPKYGYNCVYISHSIRRNKAIWKSILSQMNIYSIFPATVPFNSIKKILEGACIRKTSKYILQSALWISRLLIELANRNEKVCLTLDCSNTNRDGPDRFCTEADNPETQSCYFNSAKDKQVYNAFVSQRIKTSASDKTFEFKIVELKSKTNSDLIFDAREELRNLERNDTSKNRRKKIAFGNGEILSVESVLGSETSNGQPRKRAKPNFIT